MKTPYIIYEKTIAARSGCYVNFPAGLNTDIQNYLVSTGIHKLYSHQAAMFEAAQNRQNVVITTSTASGKTLSFLLPVLQQILADPQSRAIFIYPTKALASDQYRSLQPIIEYFGDHRISAGVYDGDTPANERTRIRNSANIILTNPEMLNMTFLPNHSKQGFQFLFKNLKFVVIDELHSFRGAFGSHLANVIRRMNRICDYYRSSPQFLCSSATIANPVELAENMCSRPFTLVSKDGSPASERRYHIVQPPMLKGTDIRKAVNNVAASFIPQMVVNRRSFIAFCKSRKAVEIVLKESQDRLKADTPFGKSLSGLISGYRGGYKSEERKLIEQKMISGQLQGLISTNALELGIDIGSVEATLLAGYPGTKASFLQQSGRAGRGNEPSDTYLILDNLPFDQYIALEPEWLFETGSENAVIDTNNLFIELAHARSAAAELPLTLNDLSVFPDLGEIIPVLMKAGELRSSNGKFVWCGGEFPAGDYSLRNMDNVRYKVIHADDGTEIAELDEMQAYREAHEGAIYMHDGQSYIIESLSTDRHEAIARPTKDDFYTEVFSATDVSVINTRETEPFGRSARHFGDVKVSTSVAAFKRIQFHNHQVLGVDNIDPPLAKTFETEGVWIDLPVAVSRFFESISPGKGPARRHGWKTYFEGTAFAILNAAMMTTMATTEDISAAVIKNNDTEDGAVSICLYDLYVGGLGFAEKAYSHLEKIVSMAIKMVSGCKCKDGCAACVGDYHLDKKAVLWGLQSLYDELTQPIIEKSLHEEIITEEAKPFSIEDVEEKWADIASQIGMTGDSLSTFLSGVSHVEVHGSTVVLHVESPFVRSWVLESSNKQKLENILSGLISSPLQGIALDAVSNDADSEKRDISDKLGRRYCDLSK